MHIAFLTPEYPHQKVLHAAGIGTSIKNLALALAEEGVTVSIFVYAQASAAVIEENAIKIHLIQQKKHQFFKWFYNRKDIQHYVNNFIKQDQIDIIEAPDWTGIAAFINFKAPLVVRFHGTDAYFCHLEKRQQKLKNFWFEKLSIKKAKAYIAPTDFAGNLTAKIFNIKNKLIKTIHYGLIVNDFENKEPGLYIKGLILYIGTIIRKKGVLELSKIMEAVVKKNPAAHLVMIGADSFDIQTQSHSTWELLKAETNEDVKDKITYLGKVPYSEVKDYIKNANVCIFPTFAETLGMVTIECMAMQKAVVNSNIGWAQELIVNNESGFLVHPKDHELFAEKIDLLLKNDQLALEIGQKAKTRVEEVFNIKKTVQQNIDFYRKLL